MTRPSVFVGSSSEARKFAIAVQSLLQSDAEVTPWSLGVFAIGESFIESLMQALRGFDFAVLILTPDDELLTRTIEARSPRDNVVFEWGLFMGVLGRERTFVIQQSGIGLKIPTDMAGVTTGHLDWPRGDNNYRAGVSAACEEIRERIQTLGKRQNADRNMFAGLDPALIKERDGATSAIIHHCEVRAVEGRIERYPIPDGAAVVLPCNEYFDDECAGDSRSALGAYMGVAFAGKVRELMAQVKGECERTLGTPTERQKTEGERALSFGPGRAILMLHPLGSPIPVGLVSTTTQRAGKGLIAKSSFLFDGVCELVTRLADTRIRDIVMPTLGSGHGGMDPAAAFVTLMLALSEALRDAPGRPMRTVTVINFRRDAATDCSIHPIVVRRALALASAPGHVGHAAV